MLLIQRVNRKNWEMTKPRGPFTSSPKRYCHRSATARAYRQANHLTEGTFPASPWGHDFTLVEKGKSHPSPEQIKDTTVTKWPDQSFSVQDEAHTNGCDPQTCHVLLSPTHRYTGPPAVFLFMAPQPPFPFFFLGTEDGASFREPPCSIKARTTQSGAGFFRGGFFFFFGNR